MSTLSDSGCSFHVSTNLHTIQRELRYYLRCLPFLSRRYRPHRSSEGPSCSRIHGTNHKQDIAKARTLQPECQHHPTWAVHSILVLIFKQYNERSNLTFRAPDFCHIGTIPKGEASWGLHGLFKEWGSGSTRSWLGQLSPINRIILLTNLCWQKYNLMSSIGN